MKNKKSAESLEIRREKWRSEFIKRFPLKGRGMLQSCGRLITIYGRGRYGKLREADLRSCFSETGSGDHYALIQFIDWCAQKINKP